MTSKLDDDIGDAIKAAKNAIGELDDHVKSFDNAKKDIVKALSEYDKDSIKKSKQVKKAQYHKGCSSVYDLVGKYGGYQAKIDFATALDDIAKKHYDDLVDVLLPSLKNDNSFEYMKMLNIKNKPMDAYTDYGGFGKIKMPKLPDVTDELDDLFKKYIGMKEALYKTGQNYSNVGGEAEVILQRGTKFRITDVKKTGNTINVEMEIVNQPRYFDSGYEQTINSGATLFKH